MEVEPCYAYGPRQVLREVWCFKNILWVFHRYSPPTLPYPTPIGHSHFLLWASFLLLFLPLFPFIILLVHPFLFNNFLSQFSAASVNTEPFIHWTMVNLQGTTSLKKNYSLPISYQLVLNCTSERNRVLWACTPSILEYWLASSCISLILATKATVTI